MLNRSMSRYRCHEHGIVEARQVAEEVRELGDCKVTILRMECPICGRRLIKDDPQSMELKKLVGK
ncbi:MAG: hypothetical protein ACLFVK_08100 [Dehalococcoidia bacterium]